MITDSCSYILTPVNCYNWRKKKSRLYRSSNKLLMSLLLRAKSSIIYDLNSLLANSSTIVDFPTRLVPLIKSAYLSLRLFFHSRISLYIFLLKTVVPYTSPHYNDFASNPRSRKAQYALNPHLIIFEFSSNPYLTVMRFCDICLSKRH